jgi:hypothetical protein
MRGLRESLDESLAAAGRLYIKFRPAIRVAALLLLTAGAIYIFLWATAPHGIGIRTDSVEYLWGSENLAKGIGLGRLNGLGEFRPMTHWPPLYPVLLAIPQYFGMSGLSAARWLGAVNLGLMVFLLGWSIARVTNNSPWYTSFGTLVLVTSYAMWNTGLYAMTEPLYMVLGLLALLFLDNYLITEKQKWLFSASIVLALGLLTRYAAGALILASVLVLLLQRDWSFKKKIRDSFLLGLVAILPLGLWTLRNMLLAGTATNRFLQFASIPPQEWLSLRQLMAGWLVVLKKIVEVDLPKLAAVILAAVALAWFTGRTRAAGEKSRSQLWLIYCLYAACYIVYIFAARLLFDHTIPLGEERIFFPFFTAMAMLAIFGLYLLEKRIARRPLFRIALVCIYALLVTGFVRGSIQDTGAYARLSNEKGLGLANVDVTDLDIIAAIKDLSPEPVIFSDDLEVLYFLTGRPSFQINEVTDDEVGKIKAMMHDRGIYVILFRETELGDQLRASIPQLEVIYSGTGVIYAGEKQP